jgi:AcrR family transcriptional regulator
MEVSSDSQLGIAMRAQISPVSEVRHATPRKLRSDRQRNRERLIDTAKLTFSELGPAVSLDEIARRAGVGIGTLYRHFPTRDALVEAVCRHEVEHLAGEATELLKTYEPGEALHRWMRDYVGYIATNKLLAAAVSVMFGATPTAYRSSVAQITDNPVLGATSEVYRRAVTLFTEAATLLLERARDAGDIGVEIEARDLMRGLGGFTATYGDDVEGWEASALRLVDVLMNGLRISTTAQANRQNNEAVCAAPDV